jgi:serine/threonine protein kinase
MKLWTLNQKLDNGRFIIQKVLGEGGFGVTYSVQEQSTGKLFVIKTLNHIQQKQPDFQQLQVKFVNEALRLAKCSHPHIVQVYEVIQEDGLWGMVMEYIDGQDLGIYLEKSGQLSEAEALRHINQIGQALEYVHQQGFLHRDIKPNNIILRRNTQEAVLIDFGLAREYTLGQMGSMTNDRTNGYAPIEQYKRRGNFGAYTDVYALAATLYSLLTKEIPMPAEYRNEEIPLIPPKQYNPLISDIVNDAIIQGMAWQPQNRPQSVREFRELLGLISTPPKQETVQLISEVGIDYTQLRDLLAAGKWQAADEETTRVMLAITGKENDGWLNDKDIDTFPCEDLCTIDKLWMKYSNGRFGFSIQKCIHESLVSSQDLHRQMWATFGDVVGWRKDKKWMYYDDLTFDIKAPEAHLPGGIFWFDSWWGRYGWFLLDGVEGRFYALMSRLAECKI